MYMTLVPLLGILVGLENEPLARVQIDNLHLVRMMGDYM